MVELGTRHAQIEKEKNLDELMKTMVAEPVYEFYPIAKMLRGGDNVRRYYRQFMDEWVSKTSVIQEYDLTVEVSHVRETHRTIGILFANGELRVESCWVESEFTEASE